LFLWVTLPPEINTEALLQEAVKEKVAFVPGHAFYAGGRECGLCNTMRLNFSNADPAMLEEGIRRLAGVITQNMERSGLLARATA
jgi:2-aminoadipate transaminase